MCIYLTRRLGRATLKQVGEAYGIGEYSTVSSITERMKSLLLRDKAMYRRMKNLISSLTKSQEET
jgi:chromosomal replication initiation ATPase DnaA